MHETGSGTRFHTGQQEHLNVEMQAILDHAPIGIWMVGVDGRYRFVNKTFCDAVGVPEHKFLSGIPLTELLGDEIGNNCMASDRACLEQDEPHISYETLPFVDGKQHLLEITKVKVRNEAGKIIGAVGVAMDITEQRSNEDKLRTLSQAIEQAVEAVIITDMDGRVEYVNPSFTRMTGYSPEEVLGRNPNILGNNGNSDHHERLWKTISKGEVWQDNIVDNRKDGSNYPSMLSISPISDHNGQITHFVGIQQDMTEREMLESRLRQAQKMEALGTLVGGIAHDFNNMLTGIAGNIFLAKESAAGMPDLIERLDAVESLSFQAAAMIEQLLIFARKGSVEKKQFGLTTFLRETSRLHRVTIPKSISFYTEFCDKDLVVNGDTIQLQQVLLNLLNNARDAVKGVTDPAISLTVEEFEANDAFMAGHSRTGDRLFAHLIVTDNGSGICDEAKDHIFEPFFTTKEIGVGTGLGLAMSYGTIQAHDGILEVESTYGKGCSFHIYLPITEEVVIDNEPVTDDKLLRGNGEVILVADDNAELRTASRKILEKLGYHILEASDGVAAVDIFNANMDKIGLTIMDMVMPKLDGSQAAARIREFRPDAKVVFSTGYDKESLVKHKSSIGESVVLSKPYNIVELSRIIRQQLDRSDNED